MNSKADFAENLLGKFDIVSKHVNQKTKNLRVILDYFKTTSKELAKFSKKLNKVLTPMKQALTQEKNPPDSLNYVLSTIINHNEKYLKLMLSISEQYKTELIEPFELFISHYEKTNKESLKECNRVTDNLSELRDKLRNIKSRYEKWSQSPVIEEEAIRQRSQSLNDEKEAFSQQAITLNSYITEMEPTCKKQLVLIQQNEESRIEFIRKHFSNFFGITDSLGIELLEVGNEVKKALTLVNPIGDLQLFISSVPKIHANTLFEKVGTEITQDGNNEDIKPGIIEDLEDESKVELESAWKELLNATTPINTDSFVKLLKASNYKDYFIESILKRSYKQEVRNMMNMKEIGKMLNTILSSLESKEDTFGSELSGILNIAGQLFCNNTEEKPTIFLRDFIKKHNIWKKKETWLEVIQYKIDRSLAHIKFAMKEKNGLSIMKRAFNISASVFKSKGTILKEKEAKEAREETGRRSAIYSDLNVIAIELALIEVDLHMAREVILQFSLSYNLLQDKLYHLLADHDTSLILRRRLKVTSQELKLVREEKLNKALKKYSKCLLVIKYTMRLFFDVETSYSLLLVSKEFHNRLKAVVYKKVIADPKLVERSKLWLSLFPSNTITSLKRTYSSLKEERTQVFKATNKSMEEFIRLDVSRSFHEHSESTKLSIMSILRCYAIHNPEVEYCQGINFFAGILFLVVKDEELAFALFCELVKKHELDKIYRDDVPLVRKHLYQIAKIIATYLPNLHKHLLEEGTNPNYFCTPWFLTAFTFALQYSKTPVIPPLLLAIFDKFLLVLSSIMCRMDLRWCLKQLCSS